MKDTYHLDPKSCGWMDENNQRKLNWFDEPLLPSTVNDEDTEGKLFKF